MTSLHLVRHGESTWNVAGRVQGQAMQPALTWRGIAQARAAALTLAGQGVDVLVTSDLRRAVQTAEVIGAVLGLEPLRHNALREQALGDLEGRYSADLTATPVAGGDEVTRVRWGGPASESLADVHRRVGEYLSVLLAEPPGRGVALVSHADAIRVMLTWLTGGGPEDVDWSPLPPGSVTSVPLRDPR